MKRARRSIAILSMTVLIALGLFYYLNDKYIPKANADVTVMTGDVFFGGATDTSSNITIGSKSIVASKGASIANPGGFKYIPSYTFAQAAYDSFTGKINSSVDRLRKGKNPINCNNLSSSYNLNPSNIPEGELWVCNSGDVTLPAITFTGKGTIYVDGSLTVNGNLTYGSGSQINSLGVIAKNGITINSTVNQLKGVYYSNGTIYIK